MEKSDIDQLLDIVDRLQHEQLVRLTVKIPESLRKDFAEHAKKNDMTTTARLIWLMYNDIISH